MHSFEVHSNESACRKKVRLGLEEVVGRGGVRIRFSGRIRGWGGGNGVEKFGGRDR